MTRHKLIKAINIEGTTTIVHKGGYAILIAIVVTMAMWIITFMVMIVTMAMWVITFMVMVVAMAMWIITFVVMVMMMVVVIIIMMVVVVIFVLLLDISFYFLNPSSRSGYLFEVKELGIKNLAKWHIAIVAVDDFSFGLDSANDSMNMLAFAFAYHRHLI